MTRVARCWQKAAQLFQKLRHKFSLKRAIFQNGPKSQKWLNLVTLQIRSLLKRRIGIHMENFSSRR